MVAVAFWILALAAVLGAVLVVTARDVFYAAIGLVSSLVAVAGIYVTLDADFLAVAQFMIYVGGIAVLIVFAVMMTAQIQRGSRINRLWPMALALGVLVFVGLTAAATGTVWPVVDGVEPVAPLVGSASTAGVRLPDLLFSTYLFPFELAGLLLLVATIGALVIAREK